MCGSNIHEFLIAAPKCEHHLHLEGCLTPSLLFKLAARNNIALGSEDPSFASPDDLLARFDRFSSLDDFLHYYFIGMSSLIQEQDFEDLGWEYFLKANEDNVVHAEVFFDPQAHTSRGVPYDTVVGGFRKACQRANDELNISTLLIPCFLRHLPAKDSEQLWAEVKKDLTNRTLAGIGLSGSEKAFPPGAWAPFYQEARAQGIHRTAHAGEEGPVEYIREALSSLSIERIDHGFKLANDSGLMQNVAKQRILVTLCPLSNVKLRCVADVAELPIRKFLETGVQFSINSDDPAYFRSYISDNYCAVQDAFQFNLADWSSILHAAVSGSWCDEQRKAILREKVDSWAQACQKV